MKQIVGLGNPGKRYEGTRHNVGFMIVDKILEEVKSVKFKIQNYNSKFKIIQDDWKVSKKGKLEYFWFEIDGEKIELVKPVTFMNKSGEAVAYVRRKHPEIEMDEFYVVHDDLDIELGNFKLQQGKGPKLHNGVESVERSLGRKDFWRARVGVDARTAAQRARISGEAYVLMKFSDEEKKIVDEVAGEVVDRLIDKIVVAE